MAQGALRGPSGYSREPPRHPSLRINAKVPPLRRSPSNLILLPFSSQAYGNFRPPQEPFNAEPARRDLAAAYITPIDLFFKRNHGPIPVLDDIDRFPPSAPSLLALSVVRTIDGLAPSSRAAQLFLFAACPA